jgi:hypothetical protein
VTTLAELREVVLLQPEPLPCSGAPELYGEFPDALGDQMAKALCAVCPILLDCRAYGRSNPQEWGVWGGETQEERRGARQRFQRKQRDRRYEAEKRQSSEIPERSDDEDLCGTRRGYRRHRTRGEQQCERCKKWRREISAETRKKPTVSKKKPPKCGGRSAYTRHLRNKEKCEICKEAERLRSAARREKEREKKEALAA